MRNLAKPKDFMVRAYLEPRFAEIKATAREEVIEHFCRPRCGNAPTEGFCFIGQAVFESVLGELMYRKSSLQ